MECECVTTCATIIGLIMTLTTICFGFYQYNKENRFKRANYFNELRNRFKSNQGFNEIREQINNRQNLNQFSQTQIYDYAGFFEELQIAINSNFIKSEMVYYLFGHYILEFADNNAGRIQLDAQLWIVLNELINSMREIETKNIKNLKF